MILKYLWLIKQVFHIEEYKTLKDDRMAFQS